MAYNAHEQCNLLITLFTFSWKGSVLIFKEWQFIENFFKKYMKIYKTVPFVNSRHFLYIIYFNKRVSLVLFPLIEQNFNEIIFLVICICALARVNFTINNIINEAISDISWKIYVRHLFKMDILQYLFAEIKKKCFYLYLLNGEFAGQMHTNALYRV